ncbi:MAG TPA: RDD family protein [Smithellaceae bacterium]|nr:RDD family protein [Smithellaceae bacterium]
MAVYNYGGFWRRMVAFSIDNIIIIIVFFILCIIATIALIAGAISREGADFFSGFTDPGRLSLVTLVLMGLFTVIYIAYFTYFHGATGRTPGKMLLGLQVYAADGKKISFGIAFLRAVGSIISSIPFYLGFIWAAFDGRKQSWHDKIAGTVVIIKDEEIKNGFSIPDEVNVDDAPLKEAGNRDITDIEPQEENKIAEKAAEPDTDSQKIP